MYIRMHPCSNPANGPGLTITLYIGYIQSTDDVDPINENWILLIILANYTDHACTV